MDTQLSIIGGPSKFDLMLALFDRKPRIRTLNFKLRGKKTEAVLLIFGVEPREEDGEEWQIRGVLKQIFPPEPEGHTAFEPKLITCRYRTDQRTGWISLNR